MTNPDMPVDAAFLRKLANYAEIRNMNPVIETTRTIADDLVQRLSNIDSISSAVQVHVYTDEDNAWLDSLGSHPAD